MSRWIGLALALALAAPAHAELAAWDGEQVGALAAELREASKALYDTFYRQPKLGVGRKRDYHRLEQDVRRIRNESRQLADALAKGGGHDETLPIYEDLMQYVRRARTNATQVFTTQDVAEKAAETRRLLNALAPYYDPVANYFHYATHRVAH